MICADTIAFTVSQSQLKLVNQYCNSGICHDIAGKYRGVQVPASWWTNSWPNLLEVIDVKYSEMLKN